ncbi:MAG: hypothetical protein NBV66_05225 [Burkholderiaceae bacterium]|nr:hypothetical protein [Burkholderiaceae bacterium]
MQTLPIITKRTQIDVQGINGQPIFSYYQQLLGLLKKEGQDESLIHLFAEPVTNVMRGEVSWVTKLDGPIRPFDALSPEEKLSVAKTLTQACARVRRVADKVQTGAGSSAAYGSQALHAMLTTPEALASLFMVGDQLVLTQWGCIPYGAKASDHNIDTRFAEVFKPAAKVIASQKAAEVAAQSPARTFGFLALVQWLTLAALCLLLFAGLFYKQWLTVLDPGPSVQVEEGLRTRIAELWGKVDKKSAICFPPAPIQPPVVSTPPVVIPPVAVQEPPATVTSGEIDRRLKENSVAQGKFVNVTLAWENQADLDLIVVEPAGVAISMYNNNVRKSPSGGSLDIDANACQKMEGCASRPDPVENISWNVKPPAGRYDVYVALFSANVARDRRENIPYTVVVTIDGKKTSYEGLINKTDMVCGDRCRTKDKIKVASFVIP